MTLRTILSKVTHRFVRYAPLIRVEVSRSALLHNLHAYQRAHPSAKIAPVLKSNAYGHGLALVASILDREDIAFFMVDSWYEAKELRRAGIRSRIVVMGYVRPEDIIQSRLSDVDFAMVDIEQLREVSRRVTRPLRVHLKLDVGMHRQGIMSADLEDAMALIKVRPYLQLVGVCGHLGDADNPDDSRTRAQIAHWKELLGKVVDSFPGIKYRHLLATKGVRFSDETETNVLRIGGGLYGIDTSSHVRVSLKPALSMYSLISSLRAIPAGETVGYNATYVAQSSMTLGVVPTGYYEGVDRRLSNKGVMLVNGRTCPIVGRVSMNMSTIDVTNAHASVGSEVLVISSNPEDPNTVVRMANLAETTPYVILTHLPQHLRRVVVE